jgi:malonyl-CoA/methylmalonyl-CoA synthetase
MNLLDLLANATLEHTDAVAIADHGQVGEHPAGSPATAAAPRNLTHRSLHTAASALAAGLVARGLTPGDRVAFLLGNRPELAIALLAVLRAGGVALPMNLAYRQRELDHLLTDSGARFLVTEQAQRPLRAETGIDARVERVLEVEDLASWMGEPALLGTLPPVDGDALAMLLYTSGTTGASKGAMLTHQNLLATITGLLAAWAWRREDRLLLALPLFHTHGLVVGLLTALAAGATVLLHRRFDAAVVAESLRRGEATLFFGVPTMYVRLLEALAAPAPAGAEPDPGDGLARVRLFVSGSAPLAVETFEAFATLTGHRILERYGMTETGMNLSNPYAGARRPGTVGKPLPGVSIRIVDAADRDVAAGADGELLVSGGNVFAGYWNAPEKTAASFLVDAAGRRWFRTGDLARRDPADGYVTLLGRRHELVIRGGFNIYPREVEEVLLTLPGVREAAVRGARDPQWGEVPVAFVVADDPFDPEALLAACRRELASFKIPARIHRVDILPRNALGKVQKHLLTEPA